MLGLCLVVILQVFPLSPSQCEPLSEDGIPRIRCRSCSSSVHFHRFLLFLIVRLKFCIQIQSLICNKV
jgi:hypothetical protein